MRPPTPRLQLETLFLLDGSGRIVATREPQPSRGPALVLVRGTEACAWAVRADVPDPIAEEVGALAAEEPAIGSWRQAPVHDRRYRQMLGGAVTWGPAFRFPENLDSPGGVTEIADESRLAPHFKGWVAGEIAAGRSPVMGACEGGHPVSICFCARRSTLAAEAGVETCAGFRRRGHAVRVTAAWASAVKDIGLVPLYSTEWENAASLGVARKLGLIPFATDWSIQGG